MNRSQASRHNHYATFVNTNHHLTHNSQIRQPLTSPNPVPKTVATPGAKSTQHPHILSRQKLLGSRKISGKRNALRCVRNPNRRLRRNGLFSTNVLLYTYTPNLRPTTPDFTVSGPRSLVTSPLQREIPCMALPAQRPPSGDDDSAWPHAKGGTSGAGETRCMGKWHAKLHSSTYVRRTSRVR